MQNLDYENNAIYSRSVVIKSVGTALVAFLVEVTLTMMYIILAHGQDGFTVQARMIPLAALTLVLSILWLSFSAPLRDLSATFQFYKQLTGKSRVIDISLAFMDHVSNMFLPLVLTVAGSQDNFTEAVLNSSALLFILEIDDIVPAVFGLDPARVVRTHLINEAITVSNPASHKSESGIRESTITTEEFKQHLSNSGVEPIQFADLMLTNTWCSRTNLEKSRMFAPYEIKGKRDNPKISSSQCITSNCLLSRIEWKYTFGFPLSRSPRSEIKSYTNSTNKHTVSKVCI